ncbi:tyrosine-type recombinase/integrase [Tsukamurella tyrosinosolvens]|mgnify:FL=1|uniref:tyrosine-type recombinase/integrase n=1 Tax=Tsukamurella tyrosinosolvens TaxID=57704 RepID=UPI0007B23B0D|nr:tyrosine-type recombinase/integrase [Tsukamurella tyrosinosolvens]KZL95617.1 hypothetical protein AXX05_20875 [Tsukamurella tyrosinosolvens]
MARKKSTERQFGYIRKLPSGRYQAAVDGGTVWDAAKGKHVRVRHNAPVTYSNKQDASAWLAKQRRDIEREDWTPPKEQEKLHAAEVRRRESFADYSARWLDTRMVRGRPLADNTRWDYRSKLEHHILPTFGKMPVNEITRDAVRSWHAALLPDASTQRARTFDLLRGILNSAVDDELIEVNPCRIRGASVAAVQRKKQIATVQQVAEIVNSVPAQWRLVPLLGTWTSLRIGEILGLQRQHIVVEGTVPFLPVARVVVEQQMIQDREHGGTKLQHRTKGSQAREVAVPPHMVPAVMEHLAAHVRRDANAWLFVSARDASKPLSKGTFYDPHFYRARVIAGCPTLHFHELRATGATLAAQSGATLADLMQRLGHTTVSAALRYQVAASGRDAEIAAEMSRRAS